MPINCTFPLLDISDGTILIPFFFIKSDNSLVQKWSVHFVILDIFLSYATESFAASGKVNRFLSDVLKRIIYTFTGVVDVCIESIYLTRHSFDFPVFLLAYCSNHSIVLSFSSDVSVEIKSFLVYIFDANTFPLLTSLIVKTSLTVEKNI